MNPLISIVVPIYKSEPYLRTCLDRILAQTYTNYKLILVNDGSPDNCGIICDDYAKEDARITVLHKENGGVSAARNDGLKIASGEFVCFIDPDDYVGEKYIETMLSAASDETDLVICGYSVCYNDGRTEHEIPRKFSGTTIAFIGELRFFLRVLSGPISKLFRMSLIRKYGISFREFMDCYEDGVFVCDYIRYCRQINALPVSNYFITHHTSGSLSSSFRTDRIDNALILVREYMNLANKYGVPYVKLDVKGFLSRCVRSYLIVAKHSGSNVKDEKKRLVCNLISDMAFADRVEMRLHVELVWRLYMPIRAFIRKLTNNEGR